jgi:natural product biosynthesis luciferase-like monooxygenase protein
MTFGLSFFSDDGASKTDEKYRLLLESAKYADQHGFAAVWTPERHFQEVGGLYPNPSVLGAALAMITEQIKIRAGSVALPLHNPLRVVEEWSVVDNLSRGRVAVSFASGWHPIDFVLAPHCYEHRNDLMFQHLELIRRLWAGEKVNLPGVGGNEVEVKILPRPLQKELPIWITISQNPETWKRAGEIGANVLTAIVKQPLEALATKIELYRRTLVQHGHDVRTRQVTVMLHTYVGANDEKIKDLVRPSLSQYFRKSIKQLKIQSDVFINRMVETTPIAIQSFTEDDADSIASMAFERYFDTSLLCGTQQKCARLIDRLIEIGVDEVACLIDFGVEPDQIIQSLPLLNELREHYHPRPQPTQQSSF